MKRTLYGVLQIDGKATPEQIESAYLAQKDRLNDAQDDEAQNELKLVQQAHAVLADPQQRARYDQSMAADKAQDDSILYYAQGTGGGGVKRWFIIALLLIAGFVVYQRYFAKTAKIAPVAQEDAAEKSTTKPAAPVAMPIQQPPAVALTPSPPVQENSSAGSVAQSGLYDVNAVPYLTDGGRLRYREFLVHAKPRAFVLCKNGTFSILYGYGDSILAEARKDAAAKHPGENCSPYAVNDEVVWGG